MRYNLPPYKIILSNESGSAIVIAMLALMVVTLIGLSTIDTAITEKTIATNEILQKQAFYEADGGTEMAAELIEYNIDSVTGFPAGLAEDVNGKPTVIFTNDNPLVYVENFAFWLNNDDDIAWEDDQIDTDTDTDRDFYITTDNEQSRTNLRVGSSSHLLPGSAIQMAAGYEGRGKSAAVGGSYRLYKIYAQHIGNRKAKSTIMVRWRHVTGNEESKE